MPSLETRVVLAKQEPNKPNPNINMKCNLWTMALVSMGLVSLPAVILAEEKPSSVLTDIMGQTGQHILAAIIMQCSGVWY